MLTRIQQNVYHLVYLITLQKKENHEADLAENLLLAVIISVSLFNVLAVAHASAAFSAYFSAARAADFIP